MWLCVWVKVGYVLFVFVGIYVVLRLDDIIVVVNWFGVCCGIDLMFYVLVMVFSFIILSIYMWFKDFELCYVCIVWVLVFEGV